MPLWTITLVAAVPVVSWIAWACASSLSNFRCLSRCSSSRRVWVSCCSCNSCSADATIWVKDSTCSEAKALVSTERVSWVCLSATSCCKFCKDSFCSWIFRCNWSARSLTVACSVRCGLMVFCRISIWWCSSVCCCTQASAVDAIALTTSRFWLRICCASSRCCCKIPCWELV